MSEPPSPRLRILEIEIVGRGGLAHYVHNLSRALADRGHHVTLLTAAADQFTPTQWQQQTDALVQEITVRLTTRNR